MNNKEFEVKLKNAVEKSTPDVWERVQSDISYGRGEVITMSGEKKKSKVLGLVSGIAAACFLIFMAVFGITNYHRADLKAVSTVYLEVNPQIELSLNTYDVVLEATPKNEDGKKVLGDMSLKNTELDVALNAILGSMVKNGYLTKDANSVLICVENESKVKANQINLEITNVIGEKINTKDFYYAAVVQTIETTEEIKAEAQKLNITWGKAAFICSIKEIGAKASKEDLAKLSVDDLHLIFQSHIDDDENIENINSKGTAKQSKYIGNDKAKEIALKAAKVEEKHLLEFEIELDCEKGKMVYEVEFLSGANEYDYEIDAVSGEIVKSTVNEREYAGFNQTSSSITDSLTLITGEQALEIALNDAGVSRNDVRDIDTEIDKDEKPAHIAIEFKANGYEYEYEIDSAGNILNKNKEIDD